MRAILIGSINWFANILIFLIFVRAILSWFPQPRDDGLFRQLHDGLLNIAHFMTEPIVGPIRNLIRRSPLGGPGMGLDFSPIIALLLINFTRGILVQFIWGIF